MYEKKKLRRAIGGALVLMMLGAGGSICLPDSGFARQNIDYTQLK